MFCWAQNSYAEGEMFYNVSYVVNHALKELCIATLSMKPMSMMHYNTLTTYTYNTYNAL